MSRQNNWGNPRRARIVLTPFLQWFDCPKQTGLRDIGIRIAATTDTLPRTLRPGHHVQSEPSSGIVQTAQGLCKAVV
jgi:hypothetical protein